MADDSLELLSGLDCSASEAPRGASGYDTKVLTPDQHRALNTFRIQAVRNDQRYLAAHPEVRAMLSLLLRAMLIERPRLVHEYAADFFRRPLLQKQLSRYVEEHPAGPDYVLPTPKVEPQTIHERLSEDKEQSETTHKTLEEPTTTKGDEAEETAKECLQDLLDSVITSATQSNMEWMEELVYSQFLAQSESLDELESVVEQTQVAEEESSRSFLESSVDQFAHELTSIAEEHSLEDFQTLHLKFWDKEEEEIVESDKEIDVSDSEEHTTKDFEASEPVTLELGRLANKDKTSNGEEVILQLSRKKKPKDSDEPGVDKQ